MPCYDSRDRMDEADSERRIRELKERTDQLMRVICKIDKFLDGYGIDLSVLCKDAEVRAVIQEHRITDEDRWFDHYSVKFPQFNKDDISKLVKAGLLEDI